MNDVCLLLEGTYPYVAGGVSTWVYDLIRRMHDTTFSIIYLGPNRLSAKKMHYDIPPNVTDFREFYIFDYQVKHKPGGWPKNRRREFKVIEDFLIRMRRGDASLFKDVFEVMAAPQSRRLQMQEIVHSHEAWKVLEHVYGKEDEGLSFIDYFWTWRFIYLPFFSLLRVNLPKARLYHSVSTGYAGTLGAMAKLRYKRPFLLTEHGIYTRERKIEIAQADWIYSETAQELKVAEEKEFFKEWWISLFSFFSRLAYDHADEILTLFEGNRRVQVAEGADPAKTRIIPNGVEVEAFLKLPREPRKEKFRVGFMGRVVPIKDVKTFIMACRTIYKELKDVEIYIMGPTDEDEDYYRECIALVEMESLESVIKFTGKINVKEYYPKLDVIVLTSISEGQPIVALEAGACGIPVVATDVGSCRELIQGSEPDDRLIGPSGIITPVCDPAATARAVIRLARSPALYGRLSEAGRQRISRYYRMDTLIANYQMLYAHYMKEVRWQV